MKIVFMGTPDFATAVLEKLWEKYEVVAVYTRAPKESGRGKKVNKSPVHLFAESKGIEVLTPRTLRDAGEQERLKAFNADLAVVAAYGMILPQTVLDMFAKGCINVHASLLPRWRGAAPIQRAIEAGDKQSGISIMQMVSSLDAGDVLSQKAVEITEGMTGGELHDALAKAGSELLIETLDRLSEITPVKQEESLVTYAQKIDKAECAIDFSQNTAVILNKIRAFCPYPAVYFMYGGERFKIFKAREVLCHGNPGEILESSDKLVIATGDTALEVLELQRAGKQVMRMSEFLRGFSFLKGTVL